MNPRIISKRSFIKYERIYGAYRIGLVINYELDGKFFQVSTSRYMTSYNEALDHLLTLFSSPIRIKALVLRAHLNNRWAA